MSPALVFHSIPVASHSVCSITYGSKFMLLEFPILVGSGFHYSAISFHQVSVNK
jgi:hypothetical protein